jgi:RNA polymerase sporulation-specific sigma factor
MERESDEVLVRRAQQGDVAARDLLLNRYKKQVLATARRFFLTGGETEDLVQEGMCGLYAAIESYTFDKSSFATFANSCVRNRIVDVVKAARNLKNSPLNNALPIIEVGEEFSVAEPSPEDEVLKREERSEFLQKIAKILSPFEFQTLIMYIDGLSLGDISAALDKPIKSIDNAIGRAKKKLYTQFGGNSRR